MTWKTGPLMLRCTCAAALALSCGLALAETVAVQARLSGYEEVPPVSTTGQGEFRGKINAFDEVEYEFSYSDLQGTVLQAHIHFAQSGVNGGITVWLCQSATNPAPVAVSATTPLCTSPAHESSGVITAASVVGPGGAQQLGAGELKELVAALRAGAAYVNVHTHLSPGGEIRGQIKPGNRR